MTVTSSPVTFDSFGLSADVLRAIAEQGYTQPTPIQEKAIPVVLQSQDVMGAAQTGTGKTAAFVLPMIQRLLPHANTSASPARHPVRALILTPTRELADQVADNALNYAKYTPLRTAVVFGGMDMAPQTTQLRAGVEILIATPGRLLDHIQQKTVNLSQVQMLVLDEADRMLDMGFLPDLQRILNLLPAARQTLLFSATFSPDIRKLANSYLRQPITIEVARQNATSDNVRQVIYALPESDKRAAIVHILDARAAAGQSRQCIIFCNSKIGCSRLSRALEKDGVKAGAIHGDKSQSERMQTLDAFKQGEIEALVATDVAARGLDIADMPCVINFDLPFAAEDYVHRIGRTGRAGAQGDAISFCSKGDERLLSEIEKLTKRSLPREVLQNFRSVDHAQEGQSTRDMPQRREWSGERSALQRESKVRHHESGKSRAMGRFEDPIFHQPYEAKLTTSEADVVVGRVMDGPRHPTDSKSGKKAVGALLGGLSRKN